MWQTILWLGVPLAIVTILIARKIRRQRFIYYSYPSVQQYMAHTGLGNNDGIKCRMCGSREIWRYPQSNGITTNGILGYMHQCHQCETWLYRTEIQ